MPLSSTLLELLQAAIGKRNRLTHNLTDEEWVSLFSIADKHSVVGIALDGINTIPEEQRPPKVLLLQWIGLVMKDEERYAAQWKTANEIAIVFERNHIRTYALKGVIVSECYPNPQHRLSADFDCYLVPTVGDFDAWERGNQLMEQSGIEVSRGYYKNSSFTLSGLMVENHRFLTPFRGNERLKELERLLQSRIQDDKGEDRFEGTCLYRPPVIVSALFMIEHAYSHFLHEGLTWRHVMDWVMFSRKHKNDIDWNKLEQWIDEYGFRAFYESYSHLGQYLLGELSENDLSKQDQMMLADVWAPLAVHESLHGVKGKLGLVSNTLRANWKYKHFAEISMPQALWIQVKGFLFDKHPQLN